MLGEKEFTLVSSGFIFNKSFQMIYTEDICKDRIISHGVIQLIATHPLK